MKPVKFFVCWCGDYDYYFMILNACNAVFLRLFTYYSNPLSLNE